MHVKNGDSCHSYHRPVMISTDGLPPRRLPPDPDFFKFEASWLKEEDSMACCRGDLEFLGRHGGGVQ